MTPVECIGVIHAPRTLVNTLVYYMHDNSAAFRFQLSGGLSGDSARDLEQAWLTASSTIGERRFIVDVTSLTGIDDAGRELIMKWHRLGASLVVKSRLAEERIREFIDCPVTLLETDRKPSRRHPFLPGSGWFVALRSLFTEAKRPS